MTVVFIVFLYLMGMGQSWLVMSPEGKPLTWQGRCLLAVWPFFAAMVWVRTLLDGAVHLVTRHRR